VALQVLDANDIIGTRTVFFVRHAESVWNDAQRRKKYYTMARQNDHPISEHGKGQCCHLAEQIASASENDVTQASDLSKIRDAKVIYVSPLTRAVQTAVLCFGRHVVNNSLTDEGRTEFVLMPSARERHKLGGRDSVPVATGAGVVERAIEELLSLYDSSAECAEEQQEVCEEYNPSVPRRGYMSSQKDLLETIRNLRFDVQDVKDRWWRPGPVEPESALRLRMQEFMSQLLYSPHDTMVVVGHSLFFQNVFRHYLSDTFTSNEASLAKDLQTLKMPNCGVVRLELDPRQGPSGRPITSARPVFGSVLSLH
jgi:broad specificity phosphatase PhoE